MSSDMHPDPETWPTDVEVQLGRLQADILLLEQRLSDLRVEAQDIEQRHHWLTQQVGGLQSYLEAVRMLDTYQRDRDGLKAAEDGGERIIRYLGYDLVPHVKDGQWWFTVRDHCEPGQQRTHPQVHMTVSRTDPDVAFREAQEWVDEQPAF